MKHTDSTDAISEAIRVVGQSELARKVGVAQSTPAMWRKRGAVPAEYCALVEAATDRAVTREMLRPDDWHRIWPELAEQKGCHISDTSADQQQPEAVSA